MIGQQFSLEVRVRAIFLDSFEITAGETISLQGEVHNHLTKVVRIKKGQRIKVLNGMGMIALAEVIAIDKRETELSIYQTDQVLDQRKFHIIVGLTKKEAMEEIIRKAVELGVRSVQFVITEYSQQHLLKKERVNNILESAYCQSNNPWKLDILERIDFSDVREVIDSHSSACFMSLRKTNTALHIQEDSLLIIGPEEVFPLRKKKNYKSGEWTLSA